MDGRGTSGCPGVISDQTSLSSRRRAICTQNPTFLMCVRESTPRLSLCGRSTLEERKGKKKKKKSHPAVLMDPGPNPSHMALEPQPRESDFEVRPPAWGGHLPNITGAEPAQSPAFLPKATPRRRPYFRGHWQRDRGPRTRAPRSQHFPPAPLSALGTNFISSRQALGFSSRASSRNAIPTPPPKTASHPTPENSVSQPGSGAPPIGNTGQRTPGDTHGPGRRACQAYHEPVCRGALGCAGGAGGGRGFRAKNEASATGN